MSLKFPLIERHFEPSGAAQALERAANGFDGQISGSIFQIHASSDGFHVHVAEHVRDVDAARIIVNLQLGIFGNADFKIGAQIVRRRSVGDLASLNVHTIPGLFGVHFHLGGRALGDHHHVGFRPGANGYGAVGIVNRDDGMWLYLEVPLDTIGGGGSRAKKEPGNQQSGCLPVIADSEEWLGCSSAVDSAFGHLREQVRFLLVRIVQIIARDFVFGFFSHAFFTQSDVVVNNSKIIVQGSSHNWIGFGHRGNAVAAPQFATARSLLPLNPACR